MSHFYSTVKKYTTKYKNLIQEAKQLFPKQHNSYLDNRISWDIIPPDKPCGYILEFYNQNHLLWLKVGTTERPLRERIKEHLTYYKTKYPNIRCKVKAVYLTDSPEAGQIIESALREVYKNNYCDSFIKNDRFLKIHYKEEEKNNERFLTFLELVASN